MPEGDGGTSLSFRWPVAFISGLKTIRRFLPKTAGMTEDGTAGMTEDETGGKTEEETAEMTKKS
jgi:hypothetical protein